MPLTGQPQVVGWRDVPVDTSVVGPIATKTMPRIRQVRRCCTLLRLAAGACCGRERCASCRCRRGTSWRRGRLAGGSKRGQPVSGPELFAACSAGLLASWRTRAGVH